MKHVLVGVACAGVSLFASTKQPDDTPFVGVHALQQLSRWVRGDGTVDPGPVFAAIERLRAAQQYRDRMLEERESQVEIEDTQEQSD